MTAVPFCPSWYSHLPLTRTLCPEGRGRKKGPSSYARSLSVGGCAHIHPSPLPSPQRGEGRIKQPAPTRRPFLSAAALTFTPHPRPLPRGEREEESPQLVCAGLARRLLRSHSPLTRTLSPVGRGREKTPSSYARSLSLGGCAHTHPSPAPSPQRGEGTARV